MTDCSTALRSRGKKLRHLNCNFQSIDIVYISALRDVSKLGKSHLDENFEVHVGTAARLRLSFV